MGSKINKLWHSIPTSDNRKSCRLCRKHPKNSLQQLCTLYQRCPACKLSCLIHARHRGVEILNHLQNVIAHMFFLEILVEGKIFIYPRQKWIQGIQWIDYTLIYKVTFKADPNIIKDGQPKSSKTITHPMSRWVCFEYYLHDRISYAPAIYRAYL